MTARARPRVRVHGPPAGPYRRPLAPALRAGPTGMGARLHLCERGEELIYKTCATRERRRAEI